MNRVGPALLVFLVSLLYVLSGWAHSRTDSSSPPSQVEPSPEQDRATHDRLCSGCHPVIHPRSYHKEEWPGKIEDMRRLARERGLRWSDEDVASVKRFFEVYGR